MKRLSHGDTLILESKGFKCRQKKLFRFILPLISKFPLQIKPFPFPFEFQPVEFVIKETRIRRLP